MRQYSVLGLCVSANSAKFKFQKRFLGLGFYVFVNKNQRVFALTLGLAGRLRRINKAERVLNLPNLPPRNPTPPPN